MDARRWAGTRSWRTGSSDRGRLGRRYVEKCAALAKQSASDVQVIGNGDVFDHEVGMGKRENRRCITSIWSPEC